MRNHEKQGSGIAAQIVKACDRGRSLDREQIFLPLVQEPLDLILMISQQIQATVDMLQFNIVIDHPGVDVLALGDRVVEVAAVRFEGWQEKVGGIGNVWSFCKVRPK